jgi:hypothetical protein
LSIGDIYKQPVEVIEPPDWKQGFSSRQCRIDDGGGGFLFIRLSG